MKVIHQVLQGTSLRDRAHLWVWGFSHLIVPCRWISAVGEGWGEEGLKVRGQGGELIALSRQERRKKVKIGLRVSEGEEDSCWGIRSCGDPVLVPICGYWS